MENKIQEDLLEFLCYTTLNNNSYYQLESIFFHHLMINTNKIDKRKEPYTIKDLLNYIKMPEYLVELVNSSKKNHFDKESKSILYNRILSTEYGTSCLIKNIKKTVLTNEYYSLITKTIIDKYPNLIIEWSRFIPQNRINSLSLSKEHKDILTSYLLLNVL